MLDGPWQPFFEVKWIWIAGGLLTFAAVWSYSAGFRQRPWRNSLLGLMRLLLIAMLVLVLMGPSRNDGKTEETERARIAIVVDTSASMQTVDVAGRSRIDFVREVWLDLEFRRRLEREAEVSLYEFDETLRGLTPMPPEVPGAEVAVGSRTLLTHCLSQLIAGLPSSGDQTIVVISDGNDTTSAPIQPVASLARARMVPMHTVTLGGQGLNTDLAVSAVPGQEFLLVGEPGVIQVRIFQTGTNGETTRVYVECNGERQNQVIACNRRDNLEFDFPIRHHAAGMYRYDVVVEPLAEERDTLNNQQQVFVRVVDERLRVLILEGEPYWDTKFIANSIRQDERLELVQIVQATGNRQERIVTRAEAREIAVPKTAEEWSSYDVVILGGGLQTMLSVDQAAALVQSVDEYGTQVVLARGRPYDLSDPRGLVLHDQLAVIEPVSWGDGRLTDVPIGLTHSGVAHPVFYSSESTLTPSELIRQLPPLKNVALTRRTKAGVTVLARAVQGEGAELTEASPPAMTMMNYGRGRILTMLGEGHWQWRLLPDDGSSLFGFYDRFWSNAIRWLAMGSGFQPGQDVSMKVSHQMIRQGGELSVDIYSRLSAEGLHVDLLLIAPDGQESAAALEDVGSKVRRTARLTPTQSGLHRLVLRTEVNGRRLPDQEEQVSVYEENLEITRTDAMPMPMRLLAEGSGGRVLSPDRPEELLDLLERRRIAALTPDLLSYRWDRLPILLLILGWAGVEWIARKKGGLV